MSIMLITHNFGLVAERGDDVAVMYSGKVVEEGSVKDVFDEPLHPYTHGLLGCIPVGFKRKTEVDYIPGTLPSPINPPVGCRFHPRCKYATEKCVKEEPQLIEVGKNHTVACHLYGE
jgi:oligopeptide/dipeptide ABC transporter ATP-binding protein